MTRTRDDQTFELLEWEPPAIAPGFPEPQVRASTLCGRLSRAVAEALREARSRGVSREAVAEQMSEFLGKPISVAVLDQYASQAREDYAISADRLVALAHATGDMRLIQALLDPLEHAAIPQRLVPAIRQAMIDEEIDRLTQRREVERRAWRGRR